MSDQDRCDNNVVRDSSVCNEDTPLFVTLSIDLPTAIAELLEAEARRLKMPVESLVSLWTIAKVRKY